MSSRHLRALALIALLGTAPAGAEVMLPPGVEPVSDAALDAVRGQALIEWQGVVLRFSLERSVALDARPLAELGTSLPLVVQNGLDGRMIEVVTTLNATLNHARWLLDQRTDALVRQALSAPR